MALVPSKSKQKLTVSVYLNKVIGKARVLPPLIFSTFNIIRVYEKAKMEDPIMNSNCYFHTTYFPDLHVFAFAGGYPFI